MNFLNRVLNITSKLDRTLLDRLEESRQAAHREDYEQALALLQSAKELVDKDQLKHKIDLNITLIQIDAEQLDDAKQLIDHLETAIDEDNESQILWLWVTGRFAHAENDLEKAREIYQALREKAKSVGNARFEGRASAYLADIYLRDENASFAIHLLKSALKQLEQVDDAFYQSYAVGKLGEAHIASQQKHEGLPLLERALRIAERLNQKRYIRQWQLELGIYHLREHQYEIAHDYLQTAIQNFPNDRKQSSDYVRGLCWLSYASRYLNTVDQPLVYAQQAGDIARDVDDEMLVNFSNAILGLARFDAKDYETATQLIQQAVIQGLENPKFFSPELLIELMRRQATIQSKSDVTQAIATYGKALDLAKQHELSGSVANVQNELGQLFRREKDYSQAIQVWKQAIQQYEINHDNIQAARLLCDLMQLQLLVGQEIRALHAIEQALQILNLIDDPITRGIVFSNAAMFYAEYGEIKTAEQFFVESIENAKALQNPIAEATRRANYGWLLVVVGRTQRAQVELKTALDLCHQHHLQVQSAIIRNNLGLVERIRKQPDVAIAYHQAALDEYRHDIDELWQMRIMLDLAQSLLYAEQPEEAKAHIDQSLDLARKTELVPFIVRTLIVHTRYALAFDQLAAAKSALSEAANYSKQIQSRRIQMALLTTQSQYYAATQQLNSAQETWVAAEKLYDLMQAPKPAFDWLTDGEPD